MNGYRQANYMALENWVNVYDGVGIKPFVRDDVYEIIKQYKLYV